MTWSGPRLSTIVRTTVVLPEPDPPATPMTIGSDPTDLAVPADMLTAQHSFSRFFTVPTRLVRRPMRVKLTSAVASV